VALIRALGDNKGCMALKGATPDHDGAELPDRWALDERQLEVAARWQIDPQSDLRAHVGRAREGATTAAPEHRLGRSRPRAPGTGGAARE